jgi:hypothetical protein
MSMIPTMLIHAPIQSAGRSTKLDNFGKTLITKQDGRNKLLALDGTI